jgi:hypothetical protein
MKESAYFRFMNEQGKIELTLIRPSFVGDFRFKVYGPRSCRTLQFSIMSDRKRLVFFFQTRESAEANGLKLCSACELLGQSCGDAYDLQAMEALRQSPGKMKSKLAEKSSRNPVPTSDEVAELVDLSLKDYLSLLPGEWYRLRYLVLRVTDFTRSKL